MYWVRWCDVLAMTGSSAGGIGRWLWKPSSIRSITSVPVIVRRIGFIWGKPPEPGCRARATCLKCHPAWTEEQAKYAIDSIRAHFKGKMRKAEFWISALIDKIVEGKKAGLDGETIKKAQDQHLKAHILWEYWTAENSDGFHNPTLARESLTKSVNEAQAGIKVIDDALKAKTAPAAPAK